MASKKTVLSLLITSAIFLSPINLFAKWGESTAYVDGIFSDYLLQKFWIGEIPVLFCLALWLPPKIIRERKKIWSFLKKNIFFIAVLLLLVAKQFSTQLPVVSVRYLLIFIEWGLFAWCLHDLWPQINSKLIQHTLLLVVLFQVGVASLQFIQQKSLFPYEILGETQLTHTINIARTTFKTGEKIIPYGTTAHPNILAGTVLIFGLLWLKLRMMERKHAYWLEIIVILLISWLLFLTQSQSALLAVVAFVFFQSFPRWRQHLHFLVTAVIIGLPLMIMVATQWWPLESFSRRVFLNAHSVFVFTQQPLLGTGLGMFTTTFTNSAIRFQELVRFVQPVHNVFLLLLAEIGLIGWGWGIWLVHKIKTAKQPIWLLLFAVLLSLDHYFITQWVGGMMIAIVVAALKQTNNQQAVRE